MWSLGQTNNDNNNRMKALNGFFNKQWGVWFESCWWSTLTSDYIKRVSLDLITPTSYYSISTTFDEKLIHTKVLHATFFCAWSLALHFFLRKKIGKKMLLKCWWNLFPEGYHIKKSNLKKVLCSFIFVDSALPHLSQIKSILIPSEIMHSIRFLDYLSPF